MKTVSLNTVVENFDSLLLEEKELAVDIINKVYAEAKRDSLHLRSEQSSKNMKKGKVKKGTLSDLYKDLENG